MSQEAGFPFIHLRVHSAYSLAEGAIKTEEFPNLCKINNMPAVGICDTNNMFGALDFTICCEKNGVQPIIGVLLNHFVSNSKEIYKLPIFAKNEIGYKNLLKLVSFGYLNMNERGGIPVSSFEEIKEFSEGILVLTGGRDGFVGKKYNDGKEEEANNFLNELNNIFKDHLYIELQRHPNSFVGDKENNLINYAYEKNIPLIATNDVFFSDKSMYEAHDALMCISDGTYVNESNRRRVTSHNYFKSSREMKELFKDIPESINNTYHFSRRCYYAPKTSEPMLPTFVKGDREEDTLRKMSFEGLEKRLKQNEINDKELIEHYEKRLDTELNIINNMGFPGYFLIVSDFIKWAKSKNIPVGPGRGSGAGSLVAYSLTITDMDPIKFGLIFERFLNPERVSMPDFDIDFCQERRDEVISYVCEKYGSDKVSQIITFGKLQARAVIRDVGRVLQMPYSYVDKICKLIPNHPANPMNLIQSIEAEPKLKQAIKDDNEVEKLVNLGIKLEGLFRHASTHAAGIVIADRPIYEVSPLYKDDKSDLFATQFSMKYAEMSGLVKFDFLGLKTLSVISLACKMIEKNSNGKIKLDISKINLHDEKTLKLLCDVDVMGVFQLESGGMKEVLRKMQPDRFEDIIALVALYRPGPMEDIPRYLNCKHGREKVTYLHKMMEPILEPTYGVMVYQEQVMNIAQKLGGYSLGEADLLRRAMGKKIKSEMDLQRERFVDGCIKKEIKEETASEIFDAMAKFAGYGFNKSHSAPYGLLSYQTAYLKANHPLEFYAATMSYDINNMEKLAFFRSDMIRLNYKVLPPCINNSNTLFSVEDGGVRWALSALKNVGEAAVELIIKERCKNGIFKGIDDFCRRVPPSALNKRQLEVLISSGAFDCFEYDRATLYEGIENIIRSSQNYFNEKEQNQTNLFDLMKSSSSVDSFNELKLNKAKPWGFSEKLKNEFDALSFYLSDHPLKPFESMINNGGFFPSSKIDECSDGQKVKFAALLINKQERSTRNEGKKFAFLQCLDLFGSFEVAVFPKIYVDYRDTLEAQAKIIINATARRDEESLRFVVSSIKPLNVSNDLENLAIRIDSSIDVKLFSKFINNLSGGETKISFYLKNMPPYPELKMEYKRKISFSMDDRMEILNIPGVIKVV